MGTRNCLSGFVGFLRNYNLGYVACSVDLVKFTTYNQMILVKGFSHAVIPEVGSAIIFWRLIELRMLMKSLLIPQDSWHGFR